MERVVLGDGRAVLYRGDCMEVLAGMEAGSVDSIITDPPYGLGFMGKDWDHGVPGARFWREALRVAKPGALPLAFGGTRTFHRLAVAIEDAGFELRDTIMWVYGSGFPKSHDISKAIDKAAGAEREVVGSKYNKGRVKANGWRMRDDETGDPITAPATDAAAQWDGWGTALKPAWEPIIVAMKPLDGTFAENALKHGVAGLWIDGARVGAGKDYADLAGICTQGGNHCCVPLAPRRDKPRRFQPNTQGRWPANVIHDGSEEVVGLFPVTSSGRLETHHKRSGGGLVGTSTFAIRDRTGEPCSFGGDSGSAARFFYCAKASKSERDAGLDGFEERDSRVTGMQSDQGMPVRMENGVATGPKAPPKMARNHHPTVKPLELMRYLCRLTATPTGGVVLDMFMGSGTTGVAAALEGREFIGIDLEAEYVEIARARVAWALAQPRQPRLFAVEQPEPQPQQAALDL